jgi:BRO family, N-terminal domain
MSEQRPAPVASNTFERIKRVNSTGHEWWSARDLARVLQYLNFRNFQPVIEKAMEACVRSGHAVADQFAEMRNMVGIGSGAQREVEDWALSRYACYLVIQNAKRALGIDLGTTNSTVAQVQLPLDPAGSPELLCECISIEQMTPSGPLFGSLVPSVVAINKSGKTWIGERAKRMRSLPRDYDLTKAETNIAKGAHHR